MSEKKEEQVRGCCNSCSSLATCADIACVAAPFGAVCIFFVEQVKQMCERCCYMGMRECLDGFKNWKIDFQNSNPKCPKPD